MDPIKTIITNKSSVSKTIHWAGKNTLWLEGSGKTEVPFELWSVAEDYQKNAILASIEDGQISLELAVLGSNGKYTIVEFNPLGTVAKKAKAVPASEPKVMDTTKQQVAELDHTVRVTNLDTANMLEGMGAKKVGVGPDDDEILPTREIKNGEPEKAEEPTVEKEQPVKKTRSKKS